VDSRQKLHFKHLFKVAEKMGFEQATRSEHLSYESVNDANGDAFSSRDARGLSLEELRAQIDEIVKKDYLSRHKSEWDQKEINSTAEKITLAALKYGMLRIDPSSPIKFILSQWIALEGETGPYLQYVITRCKSLLAKAEFKKPEELKLEAIQEEELYYALYRYNEIVEAAALEYRPNHLSNYLFDIAKLFNRFYKECPVLNAEEDLKNSRLELVAMTQKILEDGFKLLNIPTIDRM
ncbi:MAG: DALR anticodon-binding domain-containing protein, partial [Bdellovibrionota bacterium]